MSPADILAGILAVGDLEFRSTAAREEMNRVRQAIPASLYAHLGIDNRMAA